MLGSPIRLLYRLLIGGGVVVLAWTGGAIAYAAIYQRVETSRFEQKSLAGRSSVNSQTNPSGAAHTLHERDVVGQLGIPEAGISVIVLEGVEDNTLAIAAGHIPGTALPGTDGNVTIAAHRDTYFRRLRTIRPGNLIQFSTPRETFWYSVTTTEIVQPSEIRVMQSHGYPELTLVTCYPFSYIGEAPQRFVVHARPLPSARREAMNVH